MRRDLVCVNAYVTTFAHTDRKLYYDEDRNKSKLVDCQNTSIVKYIYKFTNSLELR